MNLDNIQDKLMEVTGKVQGNKYIQAISKGMMGGMGVLIAGTVLNLIVNLPIPGFTTVLENIGLLRFLQEAVLVFQLTVPMSCFLIAYYLAEENEVDPLQAGVAAFMCYLLLVPAVFDLDQNGQLAGTLAFKSLTAENMLTAILVGLLASALFAWAIKKNIVIKLPDSMPAFVKVALESIPSALITVLPFVVLRYVFAKTQFGSFPDFVSMMIAAPFIKVGNSLGGHLLFLFLNNLVWFFGIHNSPIAMVAMVAMMPAMIENTTAVMSGLPAPNELSMMSWLFVMQMFGGSCSTIGLAIDTVLFAKSERYKAQGKVQLVPSLFNVMEPCAFGMPLMLNPVFFVPMTLGPIILYILFYLGLKMHLYTTPIVMLNTFLPGFIQSFFMGGGIGLGIFSIVAVVLSCAIWLPFLRAADKNELRLEKEAAEAAE